MSYLIAVIPNIEKYPSLKRAMEIELSRVTCNSGCQRNKIISKYRKLVETREKYHGDTKKG